MSFNLSFSDIFILFGITQGLFLSGSLLISRFFSSKTNRYFAFTVSVLSMITYCGWLNTEQPFLVLLYNIVWEFLLPPVFFIYLINALGHHLKDKYRPNMLYIPFVSSTSVHLILDLDFQLNLYDLPFSISHPFVITYVNVEYYLAFGFNLFIVMKALKLVRSNSNLQSPMRIKWLSRFCCVLLILILVWSIADLLEVILGIDIWTVLWFGLSMVFIWICYAGICQLQLLERKKDIHTLVRKSSKRKPLGQSQASDRYLGNLEKLMIHEKMFKDPDIGRDVIAEKLAISAGYLSQLVNSTYDSGITEYINSYRVNDAKRMLSDNAFEHYPIWAIGLEAGFKTKSSFYSTFKKYTGIPPGTYKKKY